MLEDVLQVASMHGRDPKEHHHHNNPYDDSRYSFFARRNVQYFAALRNDPLSVPGYLPTHQVHQYTS